MMITTIEWSAIIDSLFKAVFKVEKTELQNYIHIFLEPLLRNKKIIQELLNRFSIPELPLNSKRTSISTMKHILTFYLQNWNINCFKNIRLHKIMFYKHGRFMGIWYWHDSLRKKLIWKLVTIFWWNLRYPDLLLCITMI